MKIDKNLNMIIPLERDDGSKVYVHSMPISRDVFDRNYVIIAKTFAAIYGEGLGPLSGPRICALMMRDIAQRSAGDNEELRAFALRDVEQSLFAEIRRLTNVALPTPNGWEQLPLQHVIDHKLLDEDDIAEVENAICFFTVQWRMQKQRDRVAALEVPMRLWGGQLSASSLTEWIVSLTTSNAIAPSEMKAALSVPS